eukprot:12416185-Karenia_brevis.AAC.1
MTLNADNNDNYPEYRSVAHGTNHRSAVRIKQQQRLRTTSRIDNHLGTGLASHQMMSLIVR